MPSGNRATTHRPATGRPRGSPLLWTGDHMGIVGILLQAVGVPVLVFGHCPIECCVKINADGVRHRSQDKEDIAHLGRDSSLSFTGFLRFLTIVVINLAGKLPHLFCKSRQAREWRPIIAMPFFFDQCIYYLLYIPQGPHSHYPLYTPVTGCSRFSVIKA